MQPPIIEPINYATPAIPHLEGPPAAMMKIAIASVIAQLPWFVVTPEFWPRDGLENIILSAIALVPSIVGCLLATIAYYRFDRRHPTSLVIVLSLVIIYAGLWSYFKFENWRHWYAP